MYKNKKALLNKMVFMLLLFFSLWSFSLSFIQNPLVNKETAEFFMHLASLASIGYGVFTFLSVCTFTRFIKPNKILYFLLAIYFIAVLTFQLTTDFASVTGKDNSNLWIIEFNNKEIYLLVSFIHNSLVLSSFIQLIIFIRGKIDYIQRKQSVIILITGVISFVLASLTLFLPKLIPRFQIPLLVDLCMMIFAVGFVYSIVKYDLFEITPKMVVNQIIDVLPVGLIISDINHHIIRFNKSLLEITNRSTSDFENKQIGEVVQSLTREKFNPEDESDFVKRVNIVTAKSEPKPVLLYFKRLIDSHNRLVGAILLFQDIEQLIITQKKLEGLNQSLERRIKERTKELMLAKEKAEESNRLKSAFLNNISHEIRTPVNAISGFSGFLNNHDLSEEKREGFVKIIQNSSDQLVSIVTNILTISSLEAKQEICNIDKVCVNQIFDSLYSTFKQNAKTNNISLIRKQPLTGKQSEIFTDKTKLVQILTNLLSNALKFTHEGFIEFGYSLKGSYLEFYVKDTGIGIKPEFHEKIFERFRQADISIDKLYGGLGIGLSISKGYTELLGGKIRVQSEPGKGSTFYFTIPRTQHNKQKSP